MAADTLQRRVVVFLDTKGAEGSIQEVSKRVKALDAELRKLPAGSDAFLKKTQELAKGKAILEDHRKAVADISKAYRQTKDDTGGMLGMAAKIFTVDAVLQFGKAVFDAGSAMAKMAFQQEALAKKNATVFGPELQRVTMMAKEHAASMGLTTSQYLSAAAAAQDLLVPMGFTRRTAADISTQLTNLSGALSEWTGGTKSATEVNATLTKALLGEREELKGLGISISEADVQQRLFDNHMDKATGQALEQAKAMATLQLVLEKSTDAQTAFVEGGDSNLRKMAETEARIASMKEEINTGLLPAWASILDAVNKSVQGIDLANDSSGNFFDMLLVFAAGPNSKFNMDWAKKRAQDRQAALMPVGGSLLEELGGYSPDAFGGSAGGSSKGKTLTKQEQADLDRKAEKAKREREQALRDLAELNKQIAKARKEFEAEQSADELAQRLLDIEQRYASELEKAIELEGKNIRGAADARKAVEAQIQAEREAAINENLRAAGEKARAEWEAARQRELERAEAENAAIIEHEMAQQEADARYEEGRQQAAERIRLTMLDEQQRELDELRLHFEEMLALAESYGLDASALREHYEQQQAGINAKYAEEVAKKDADTAAKRVAAAQAMFQGLGELASAAGELFAGESDRASKIQKAATLAQLAFDTASAISSLTKHSEANPANSVTFGLAGVAQFASGIARILINIKRAKDLLSGAPKVQQKAEGGFAEVVGGSDGRTYNARHIGAPGTGLLNYGSPVTLANERGPEYFVAAEDLRNPQVFNAVRSIENLRQRRLGQFADGGATDTVPAPSGGMDASVLLRLDATLSALAALLGRGVPAIIEDRTIRDMMDRDAKMKAARG